MNENRKDAGILLLVIFAGILLLSFFRIKHSVSFLNLDEFLWMYRSRFFIDRIMEFDFSNLIQSSQPGIMVMWFSGPFMKIMDFDFNSIVNLIGELNRTGAYNVINDPSQNYYAGFEQISFMFNIPIVSAMVLFVVSLYYFLKKLCFSRWAAVFALLLIVTTPYYIFFTTPTDKLVGIFSVLSLLSLLVYAGRRGGKRFLLFSGVLGSWAALTKMSALFLIPFSFLLFAAYGLNWKDRRSFFSDGKKIKAVSRDFLTWFFVFTATSIVFLPTIIVNPRSVADLFERESSGRNLISGGQSLSFLEVASRYLSDTFILSFNLYIIAVFVAFLCLIIQRIKRNINIRKEVLILFAFVIFFFVFAVFYSGTYSFRYLVPILIVFQILSGLGIYEFSNIIIERNKIKNKNEIYAWAIVFILVSQALLIHYSEIVPING